MLGINILGQTIKYFILDSWFITTIIFIQPLFIGRLTIKLIKLIFIFGLEQAVALKAIICLV